MSEKVKNMFADIADDYDRINGILSFGIHNAWRKRAVAESRARPGDRVLDCATGTGDLALEFKKAVGHSGYVLRSEEHTSELQSRGHLVCRLLLEKKK